MRVAANGGVIETGRNAAGVSEQVSCRSLPTDNLIITGLQLHLLAPDSGEPGCPSFLAHVKGSQRVSTAPKTRDTQADRG